jgi:hypothetical protein
MGTYTDSDVIRYWKVLKKTTVNSASFTSLSMKTDGTGFLYTTNDTTHAYEITVVGRGTAGTNDNKSAHYKFSVTVDNTAGTVAIVNTSLPTTVSEEIAAWDCQVVANDTNDLLDIQVKGDAASTVSWRAMVDEVIAR